MRKSMYSNQKVYLKKDQFEGSSHSPLDYGLNDKNVWMGIRLNSLFHLLDHISPSNLYSPPNPLPLMDRLGGKMKWNEEKKVVEWIRWKCYFRLLSKMLANQFGLDSPTIAGIAVGIDRGRGNCWHCLSSL